MKKGSNIPYYDKDDRLWKVNFEDREPEFGSVSYIVSEYLQDGLIYEYNCDGNRVHEHEFNGILASIIYDCACGHKVDINGYENQYSEQEQKILNLLINKISSDLENCNIKKRIEEIKKNTIKPVIRISLHECELSPYDSKIGDTPYWPTGIDYPHINEKPMAFIAQINLKDLPSNSYFPTSGLLQFFLAQDGSYGYEDGFKVVFHETLDTFQDVSINTESSPILKPAKMLFSLEKEFISRNDANFYKYEKTFNDIEERVVDRLLDDNFGWGDGNKLLGYPAFCQGPPLFADKYDTLLLQLDSDMNHILFGDCGVGNFFINSEKLKKGDFSDIIYYWDCF